MENLSKTIENQFRIQFQDNRILEKAFTHSSYVNEHRQLQLEDNERLEFLGDAVLEVVISDYLYHRYADWNEGKLTRFRAQIVCEPSLSMFAKKCHFDQYIRLGKGEENMGGRKRAALLCDVFEAFIGAVYLDQGMQTAKRFIYEVILPSIQDDAFSHVMDYKTLLQEQLQKNGDITIQYMLVAEKGPAHDRVFEVEVRVNGKVCGNGRGHSKKMAEQDAAKQALECLTQ